MSIGNDIDNLIMCPKCSEDEGRPIFHHKSAFRVGRRDCVHCETVKELNRAMLLKTIGVEWKPDHGPRPLVSDEERYN